MTVCVLCSTLLPVIDDESIQICESDCGKRWIEWKRRKGTEVARVHQWPLAELSLLAPAEMWEGGGKLSQRKQ